MRKEWKVGGTVNLMVLLSGFLVSYEERGPFQNFCGLRI